MSDELILHIVFGYVLEAHRLGWSRERIGAMIDEAMVKLREVE